MAAPSMLLLNCRVMGSEIGVTLDVYTHLELEDAAAELHRMEEVQNARQEMNRTKDEAV